jgi:probable H4MPT-linked C1 transfer pathway protein
LIDGQFASIAEAVERPLHAAASNWHALGAFANRFVEAWPALLIDIGSTTTDIVPLDDTGPCGAANCDIERLIGRELIYTGVRRTPVNVVVSQFAWQGRNCPLAAELFATMADAYVLLGDIEEDAKDLTTADGRPRTRAWAHARMARMICADAACFSMEDARSAALDVKRAQLALLEAAAVEVVTRLPGPPTTIVASGEGEFLIHELASRLPWKCRAVSLAHELGPMVSQCAPAHAVAILATEGRRTG